VNPVDRRAKRRKAFYNSLYFQVLSKGAGGVTGSGIVTLAATLSVVRFIPVTGMALIFGIDKFMSECRVLTNGVATIVVAAWERARPGKAYEGSALLSRRPELMLPETRRGVHDRGRSFQSSVRAHLSGA
jgi:hypothetical protein